MAARNDPPRRKLLLTGASGFLGWNLCRSAQRQWSLFGVVCSHAVEIPGVTIVRADLTRLDELKKLFEEIRPDGVLHAAALSTPNTCQLHPELSRRINVEASLNLAGLCADRSIPFLFTSTDLVFDGLHPPYRETDPTSPICVYGEQKVEAEEGILKRYPEAAICRMPLMFGDPGPAAASFIQPMLRAMKEGHPLKLFSDEFRTPLSGSDAVQGLFLALDTVRGILHLGGAERISRLQFGQLLSEVFGFSGATLLSCLQKEVPMAAPRSADVSFDSSRAFNLGFRPSRLREALVHLNRSLTL